jgi:HEAT repeat protein
VVTVSCAGFWRGLPGVRAELAVSVPALANKLSSPTEEVRIAAAGALAQFDGRGHAAVPALVKALTDRSLAVRVTVTNVLSAVAPEVLIAGSKQ